MERRGWWVRWLWTCVIASTGCAAPNPAWKEWALGGSGSGSGSGVDSTEVDTGSDGSSTGSSVSGSASESGGSSGEVTSTEGTSTTAVLTDSDATSEGGTTPDTDTDTDTTTGDDTTTSDTTSTGSSTGGDLECPCAVIDVHIDDGIFTLADDGVLWKFIPEGATFQEIGALGCEGVKEPFSMAVDRGGSAWILFNSPVGALRRIDVADPSICEDIGYEPGQLGVFRYGMAFVSEDIENPCEELHGNTYNGGAPSEFPGAGKLLRVSDKLVVDLVGPTTFNGAELTGTGDGRLFLFGGVKTGTLVEVDKVTAAYLETIPLEALAPTNAFAFAFFAGDFYFFTESKGPGSPSKVTRFDYDGDHSLEVVVDSAPVRVIGAGVSTCVPYY